MKLRNKNIRSFNKRTENNRAQLPSLKSDAYTKLESVVADSILDKDKDNTNCHKDTIQEGLENLKKDGKLDVNKVMSAFKDSNNVEEVIDNLIPGARESSDIKKFLDDNMLLVEGINAIIQAKKSERNGTVNDGTNVLNITNVSKTTGSVEDEFYADEFV